MQYCSYCGRSSEGDVCTFCKKPFHHSGGGVYRTQRDLLVGALTAFGALFVLFCPLFSYGGINLNNLAFGSLVSGQMFAYIAQYSAETGFYLILLKSCATALYLTAVISIVNLFQAIDKIASIFRWISLAISALILALLVIARIQLSQSLLGGYAGVISLAMGFSVAILITAVVIHGKRHLMPRVMYRISSRQHLYVDPLPPEKTTPSRGGSLLCVNGVFAGANFDMRGMPQVAIGRSARESQIVYPSAESQISRKHVQIQFNESENCYYITDCSRNGTYVSGGVRTPLNQPYRVARGTSLYLDKHGKNKFILQ